MDMRQWLRDQGFTVGSRGRFSPEMIAAWDAAHPDSTYSSGSATKSATMRNVRKAQAQDRRERRVHVVKDHAETNAKTTDPISSPPVRPSGQTAPEPGGDDVVRDETERTVSTDVGMIAYSTCGTCSRHISRCHCMDGPVAPKYLREME